MSILNRVASAQTSKNLAHKREFCDVDVIGAVGLAGIRNPEHLAVWRVKYLNDLADIPAAKRIFILWTRRALMRRNINAAGASRLGVQILTQWIDDICTGCNGLKFAVTPGTPTLSTNQCKSCAGTGRTAIKADSVAHLEVTFDVISRADGIIGEMAGRIKAALGGEGMSELLKVGDMDSNN